ncbi:MULTISPECIES: putative signal transducing protein [Bizionia]|uniref:DUF2007 domain-containing protein n=1 Tax=Bizionia algoritergicola TaxID=291187 RepID=A0A5D0R2U9_9FLAO|nr:MULTISPECIES: DUF2007 domain-containing protein [Bizionia]OBX23530.1 hypothetical protein BAA08_04030 [Bizionia sp. APA-3]TYB74938.1 DUF2007 domain-containing protein [Bizionia algoritergicola]
MQNTFKTIAVFPYTAEADIIKGRLEAEGIEVFLLDNHTINTNPIVSNAIGGVKLKVYAEQEAEAIAILKSISSYSLDDDGHAIHCPNCQETKIELFSTIKDLKSFMAFFVGFVFGTLPFHTRYNYRCENCKTEFTIE